MGNQHILLCWESVNHGNDVLINAVNALKAKKIAIKQVLLLTQKQSLEIKFDEWDKDFIQILPMNISEDPTDHQAIYQTLINDLLPKISQIKHLHINISPGTPAMHAVWLILHAGGRLPQGTKLWASQFNPETKRNSIKEVIFPINTYLSEIRQYQFEHSHLAIYDAEPKSKLRRQALFDLQRFSTLNDISLLICGEHGIGKSRLVETLIKTIKQKEVVTIVCGQLDDEQAETILFGTRENKGLLAEANQKILFLDEIQDLPQSVQRKLIRVLQDKEKKYRPIGDTEEEKVSFDLVCVSPRSKQELSELLDKDFFDRISMLSVTVPALRDCRQDLLDDWQRVWQELRSNNEFPQQAPSNDALKHFLNTSALKDNFRDLQKLACLTMAYWQNNDHIAALNQALNIMEQQHKPIFASTGAMIIDGTSRLEMLNQFKKEIAINAKNRYGTWRKAAEALDCDEKTLRQDALL